MGNKYDKTMKLSEEEVELVLNFRREKAAKKYYEELKEKRANCNHDYVYQFQNYKTYYYKCSKCGQEEAR